MEITEKRKWISLTLLSIIIPVGLLVTFRLTGVLPEPVTITISETKTLDTVKYGLERPAGIIAIRDVVESFYDDECVSMKYSIFAGDYTRNFLGISDLIILLVNFTATHPTGFFQSANTTFWEDYQDSKVEFFEVQAWPKFNSQVENLSITAYAHRLQSSGLKAFMELASTNQSKNVHFCGIVYWWLQSPQKYTNQMEVDVTLVYFNGTVYKKVVQPFQLKIGPDYNDSFETADAIEQGVNSWLYLGGYDTEDYYQIHVDQGYVVNINASGRSRDITPEFYIDLYNPERRWKAGSPSFGWTHCINFTADSTGEYFIRIRLDGSHGFYSLTINLYPPKGD